MCFSYMFSIDILSWLNGSLKKKEKTQVLDIASFINKPFLFFTYPQDILPWMDYEFSDVKLNDKKASEDARLTT